ncbi:MAG: ATP-dependent DNA ligase [Conexivisphaerales archaeon]
MNDLLYSRLAACYEVLESTTKRKELIDALVSLYRDAPSSIVDKLTYLTQGKLYPDYVGVEIGVGERLAAKAISMASGRNEEQISELYRKHGDLGSAAEEALASRKQASLFREQLTVGQVYDTFERIAKTTGQGSIEQKLSLLAGLLSSAEPVEAKYIIRTAVGKLRLGIADYTVLDALAIAYTGEQSNRQIVERAYNLCSDLGLVARVAAEKGLMALQSFSIQIGRPIRPMLAERLSSSAEILEKLGGRCSAEYKYDGERMQVHKDGQDVKIFSRRLEMITSNYPDAQKLVVENVKAKKAILECEAVAIDKESGELLPFQQLMHRRRKYEVEKAVEDIPISLFFFDLLMLEDKDMTVQPYFERRKRLKQIIKQTERTKVAPNIVTDSVEELDSFMLQAISEGCEGLVVKDLKGEYRAGARGFLWIKLKREYKSELTDTIDLVVVGGFHGRGKRAGVYGALLLAAYNKDEDIFETATKVGTGFTDEDLKNFHKILKEHEIDHPSPRVKSKMQAEVWFEPYLVIEVIASEITLSPIHTLAWGKIRRDSGLALRFPKFTGRIRDDKRPEDATTTQELVEMYNSQLKKLAPPAEEI